MFDNAPLERMLGQLLGTEGRSNDFRRLARRLYVVATDLDSGEATSTGRRGLQDVPISRAVQASTALPGLYKPVAIGGHRYVDGALRRTMHASLALEAGDDFVICMNPLVAYSTRENLARRGLPTVLSQTFRALIQFACRSAWPTTRTVTRRPTSCCSSLDDTDERMFFLNVFKYGDRQRRPSMPTSAPARTCDGPVRGSRGSWRHGLGLRRELLRDRERSFIGAVRAHRRPGRSVLAELEATPSGCASTIAPAP
ncbi:MAG: patatin-like phospholipase family protein [Steroidobacteraceae bacterium]